MKFLATDIVDCYQVLLNTVEDTRGIFLKTFHADFFKENNLETNWKEEYYTTSYKNVIRGMHFQTPPKEHYKMVTCLSGAVLDVILDLRKDSPTFKQHTAIILDSKTSNKMIYIPKGCAHGFLSLRNNTLLHYKVSSTYSPENDKGIMWNTIGFEWNCKQPIISVRDTSHPSLLEFESPF